MGTDYDSWMLNIVEGNSDEICEECDQDLEDCICDEEYNPDYEARFDEASHIKQEEQRYEDWLEGLKDKGGR